MQQVAANGCKARHNVKAKDHLTLLSEARGSARQSNARQMAANDVFSAC
jgi:hypothetical protein